mgnify:CR=1 FL=1
MRMAQVLEAEFIPPELIKQYSDEKIARMQSELAEILDDTNDRFNKLHFTWKRIWDEKNITAQRSFEPDLPFKIGESGVYAYAYFPNGPTEPADFTNPSIVYIGEGKKIGGRWTRFLDVLSGKKAKRKGFYHIGSDRIRDRVAGDAANKEKWGDDYDSSKNTFGSAPEGKPDKAGHRVDYENTSIDPFIQENILPHLYAIAANMPAEYKDFGEAVAMYQFRNADWNTSHKPPEIQGHITGMEKMVDKVMAKMNG